MARKRDDRIMTNLDTRQTRFSRRRARRDDFDPVKEMEASQNVTGWIAFTTITLGVSLFYSPVVLPIAAGIVLFAVVRNRKSAHDRRIEELDRKREAMR